MAVKIESIENSKLREIAKKIDESQKRDGKLKGKEYQIFAQAAMQGGASYADVKGALKLNGFERWWHDVDLCCTDGKDDGKLSFGEKAEYLGKGVGNLVKGVVKNPIISIATIAGTVALTVATGGAALPFIIGTGLVMGTAQVGVGVYKATTAKTDTEAKRAFENIGTGTVVVGLSAVGVKSANKAAGNAGVKSLQGLDKASWGKNVTAMFKAIPQSVKQSGLNIKGNTLTWMSAIKGDNVLYANSNKSRIGLRHTVQNTKVEAYKVDLNGTVEEVLAKNPGLSYEAETGKFYVLTNWGAKSYINSPDYMVVKYSTGDYNAVDAPGFSPYTDQATGVAIDITKLEPGQTVRAAKAGKSVTYQICKPGQQYMSAEGQHTLQNSSVMRYDDLGRPYQSTIEFMMNNTKLTPEQIAELYEFDPIAVAKTNEGARYIMSSKFRCNAFLEKYYGIRIIDIHHDHRDHCIIYRTAADGYEKNQYFETGGFNNPVDKDFVTEVVNGKIK